MAKVQAYRRSKPISVDLYGETYEFKQDGEGRFVCEVKDQRAVSRLLEIKDAYRLVGAAPEAKETAFVPASTVATSQEAEVNLAEMGLDELKEFARANGVRLPAGRTTEAKLREHIINAMDE